MNPYDEGQKSFTAYFSNLKKVSDNEQRIRERSKKVYAKEANT